MVILVMFCHHTNLSVTSALSCCTLSACSFSTPLLVEEVSFHQVQDSSYSTTWHWAGGQMLRCSWIINNNKKMVFYNPSLHCMVRSFFHACCSYQNIFIPLVLVSLNCRSGHPALISPVACCLKIVLFAMCISGI